MRDALYGPVCSMRHTTRSGGALLFPGLSLSRERVRAVLFPHPKCRLTFEEQGLFAPNPTNMHVRAHH